MTTTITLPFPPTVNTYYRHVVIGKAPRTLISEPGRRYREAVKARVAESRFDPLQGLLSVSVEVWVPDRRKRDVDNLSKALLDSLTHAGVWSDDSQVDDLRIYRARDGLGQLLIGGMVKVHITEVGVNG